MGNGKSGLVNYIHVSTSCRCLQSAFCVRVCVVCACVHVCVCVHERMHMYDVYGRMYV